MRKYANLINGKLRMPISGKYFKNVNPADKNDVIGLFPDSGSDDIKEAVEVASKAFISWKEVPAPKRGELIYKTAQLLEKNKIILAEVIVREMGKTMPEALGDIQSSIDVANFMAGEGRRLYGQTTHSALLRRWALTKRMPVGVCGLITAWNAPMAIITWKLFPALICGNSAVLKPSEETPLTAHLLGEILSESGFPEGVINIVYGSGSEAAQALVRHPKVKLVSFTGSTMVGKSISAECGRQMKKCSLELGGKNGLIVMPDADLVAAAKAVASGAFSTAGQRCASTSRVFAHKTVYDCFLKILVQETKKMKVGLGNDPETKVCPIINERQLNKIMEYIESAKNSGAKLIYGGKALRSKKFTQGNFIEPAIFTDVDIHSKIAQEEIFGPVLGVVRVKTLQALEKIEVGCCYVNSPTFGSEPHMPFGGLKNSGNGMREPGLQALDVFSEWKTVYIDYSSAA